MGICWGAQVFLKVLFGIEKYLLPEKKFGVYDHFLTNNNDKLLQGFINYFPMPVSRYTENSKFDVLNKGLDILAFSEMSGVGMVRCPNSKDLFILNHLEYDANTLNDEFSRDNLENIEIKIPENYFPQNDVNKTPINRWRPYAFLLFTNFINEVYQDVPFDFKRIDFKN